MASRKCSTKVEIAERGFPTSMSRPYYFHHEGLAKGFNAMTLAAAFVAAIQAQVISNTISIPAAEQTIAIRAVNSFYLGGLILDVMSALLAFLTSRWLDRLSEDEKIQLEGDFHHCNALRAEKAAATSEYTILEVWYFTWLGLSLFAPMPLLIFGIVCLVAGLYTHAWTQQPVIVASFMTLAGVAILPFIVGAFYIGREPERRRRIIRRLGEMQGDW